MDNMGFITKPLLIGGAFLLLLLGAIILLLLFMALFFDGDISPLSIGALAVDDQDADDYTPSNQSRWIYGEVRYAKYINEAAAKYDLDPALIAAVIQQESTFNPNAVSSAGAQGLMQLMPGTAKEMGVKDPFNPRQNIMGGAKYLRKMLDMFDQDVKKALAAYNAGPGNVLKNLRNGGNGIPDINETRNYVPSVLSHWEVYKKMVKESKLVISDFKGKFSWPTKKSVAPGCSITCYKGHTGQDFPAPYGTPIYAAADGTVIRVDTPSNNPKLGPKRSYGTYILIDHGNGYETLYAHMNPRDIYVKRGTKVKRGARIGLIGSYGKSTGPHLHFEIRKNGKIQDPMKYLKK